MTADEQARRKQIEDAAKALILAIRSKPHPGNEVSVMLIQEAILYVIGDVDVKTQ